MHYGSLCRLNWIFLKMMIKKNALPGLISSLKDMYENRVMKITNEGLKQWTVLFKACEMLIFFFISSYFSLFSSIFYKKYSSNMLIFMYLIICKISSAIFILLSVNSSSLIFVLAIIRNRIKEIRQKTKKELIPIKKLIPM